MKPKLEQVYFHVLHHRFPAMAAPLSHVPPEIPLQCVVTFCKSLDITPATWNKKKGLFTCMCRSFTKQHTMDHLEGKWVSEHVRQTSVRRSQRQKAEHEEQCNVHRRRSNHRGHVSHVSQRILKVLRNVRGRRRRHQVHQTHPIPLPHHVLQHLHQRQHQPRRKVAWTTTEGWR